MFELSRVPCTYHCSGSNERHGDDFVLAMTVTTSLELSNSFLDLLSKDLRESYYMVGDLEQGEQAELSSEPRKLRHPLLKGPFKCTFEQEGYVCTLHLGIDESSNHVIDDAKVKISEIHMKENGVIKLKTSVYARIDASDLTRITSYMGRDVTISLSLPEPEEFGPSLSVD